MENILCLYSAFQFIEPLYTLLTPSTIFSICTIILTWQMKKTEAQKSTRIDPKSLGHKVSGWYLGSGARSSGQVHWAFVCTWEHHINNAQEIWQVKVSLPPTFRRIIGKSYMNTRFKPWIMYLPSTKGDLQDKATVVRCIVGATALLLSVHIYK